VRSLALLRLVYRQPVDVVDPPQPPTGLPRKTSTPLHILSLCPACVYWSTDQAKYLTGHGGIESSPLTENRPPLTLNLIITIITATITSTTSTTTDPFRNCVSHNQGSFAIATRTHDRNRERERVDIDKDKIPDSRLMESFGRRTDSHQQQQEQYSSHRNRGGLNGLVTIAGSDRAYQSSTFTSTSICIAYPWTKGTRTLTLVVTGITTPMGSTLPTSLRRGTALTVRVTLVGRSCPVRTLLGPVLLRAGRRTPAGIINPKLKVKAKVREMGTGR
jgi:hypothetical protein